MFFFYKFVNLYVTSPHVLQQISYYAHHQNENVVQSTNILLHGMKKSGFMGVIKPLSDFPNLVDGEYYSSCYQKAKLFLDCQVIPSSSSTADSMIVFGNSIGNVFNML